MCDTDRLQEHHFVRLQAVGRHEVPLFCVRLLDTFVFGAAGGAFRMRQPVKSILA
jgi:hypothetical protein